jgi:hypothetical protein
MVKSILLIGSIDSEKSLAWFASRPRRESRNPSVFGERAMWSEEFFILGLVALYPFLVVCFLFSFLYNLSSLLMKKAKIEVGVSPTGPVKKH